MTLTRVSDMQSLGRRAFPTTARKSATMKETLSKRLMIYGAYGFTGKLTVELALSKKIDFIAAGRRKESLEKLQKQLNQTFEIRAFDLKDADANLSDVGVVLHCAGPFTYTSKPMVDACLAAKAHYLDITGEIPVFEQLADRDEEAKKAGIVLVPGVNNLINFL